MRERIHGWMHIPLFWCLRRCLCWGAIERDILRARAIRPHERTVLVEPNTKGQLRWEILNGLCRPQVRTVCYFRLRQGGGLEQVCALVWSWVFPGMCDVEIVCPDIGPGFVLAHGFGTVIYADRIGSDCTISQQVTLGMKNKRLPSLGHRVWIWPGAIVVGGIHVEDEATVGAGALVLHHVAAGDTVAGVPARSLETARSAGG